MQNRLLSLDVIKSIAIIMVVYCHVLPESAFDGMWSWMKVLRAMGVPLFVMCTGALMLNRDYDTKGVLLKYYKRSFLTLLTTSWVWYVSYTIFAQYDELSLMLIVKTLVFANKPTVHLWFLRMILIYYALIPLLVWARKRFSLIYFGGLLLLIGFIFVKTTIMMSEGLEYPTLSGLSILVYWGYLEIGRFLINTKNRLTKAFLAFLGGLAFVLLYVRLLGSPMFVWYDNIFVALESIGLFSAILLFVNTDDKSEWISSFSKMSFGIYLIHVLIIMLLKDCLIINPLINAFLQGIICLCMSVVIIKLIACSKVLSKLLFRL